MLNRLLNAPEPPKHTARPDIKRVKSSKKNVKKIPESVKKVDRVKAACLPARSAVTRMTIGSTVWMMRRMVLP